MKAGHETHFINVKQWMHRTDYAKSILRKSDVIVLQRVLIEETHDYIEYWRKMHKAIIVDYDDA